MGTELTNFLSDLGVSTMENALPLPLFTTAALMNYVPKSMARICADVKETRRVTRIVRDFWSTVI